MRIVGAEITTVVPDKFLESNPDVRLQVLDQMPDVNIAVGVGQGAGYQNFSRHGNWDC